MSDKWDLLKSRFQGKHEHLMDYVQDKIKLCRDLKLAFEDTKDHVLEGLYSRELALFIFGRVHTCEMELLRDVLDWQRLSDRRNVHFGQVNRSLGKINSLSEAIKPKQPVTSLTDTATVTKPKSTEANSKPFQRRYVNQSPEGSKDTRVKCFNCNDYGHISHDCPKPKRQLKCLNCQMEGHTRGRCSLVTDVAPQGLQVQTERRVSQHNSYVKTVSVNGNEF